MPQIIDKPLAGVFGAVTAFIVIGVLALAIQMTPFGGSVLGYQPFDPETGERENLWLSPDRFVVAVASGFSDGLFSGSRSFTLDHPDLVDEIINQRSANASVLHVAPPDAVSLVRVERIDYVFDKKKSGRAPAEYNRVNPPDGQQWFLVRLKFTEDAHDEDGRLRFARRQIRLVGRNRPGDPHVNVLPTAINDDERDDHAVTLTDDKLYTEKDGNEFDLIFGLPETFEPLFLEFKTGARVDMTGQKPMPPTGAPPPDPQASSTASTASTSGASQTDSQPASSSGGRVSGVRANAGQHRFSDALPIPTTNYQQFNAELVRGKLANGHLVIKTADQSGGSQSEISAFDVPTDKRLFQFDVEKLRAGSTLGRALNFAVTSVQNYTLSDAAGNLYPVTGQFAVADVDGEEVIEIQYFPADVAATNRGGIRDFRLIKDRHLKSNYRLVYLFLVQPGAQLTEFRTAPGKRATDLRSENLTAPR
jgi:hypothetical protein